MGRALKWLCLLILLSPQSFSLSPLFAATVQSPGQWFRADCSTLTGPIANGTYCAQTTTTGGRTAGHNYRWNGKAWEDITAMSGLAGLPSTDCSNTTTGKVIWNNSTKTFDCATDQTVAGAIASLNKLTATDQTFVNDTNVTITSATSTHTLGWSGTLAKARQNAETVYLDQGNTFTGGDQDFGAALSFKLPVATGASPTVSGRCAYDSTANRMKCGFNGSTVTLAISSDLSTLQPLNANLTALAGLTGAAGQLPSFTGVGTMAVATVDSCPDTGGQHSNVVSLTPLHIGCGTSSTGGLSGLTTSKYLIATAATAADTSGALSQTAGVVNAASGFSVGDISTNSADLDTSAVTGHKTITMPNKSVDLIPFHYTWDGHDLTPDGTNCAAGTVQQLNSGPVTVTFSCADNDASIIYFQTVLPVALATATFKLTVFHGTTESITFGGSFYAECRAAGTVPDTTWGTGQTANISITTANQLAEATSAAVTPNGSCAAGATLFGRYVVSAAAFSANAANSKVISVYLEKNS